MNIKFKYLYRDYGNYKKFGEVVFSNRKNLMVDHLVSQIEEILLDRLYFTVSKTLLADLHFKDYDDELDHNWHEFEKLIPTDEFPTDEHYRDIEEFLIVLQHTSLATAPFRK